ncbi:MAG: hypothetical protein JXP73_06645 [Deltaproteobacteria bacterium]|nr:hypothetical protein [Deltaproteobacteria bacterium]
MSTVSGVIAAPFLGILASMRSWSGPLAVAVLAGGAGILGSSCGRVGGAPRKDAGAAPDAAISSGGVASTGGAVGSGGAVGTGGRTTAGATGGAVDTGIPTAVGGSGGVAAGGSIGPASGGAGAASTTSSGDAGGAAGDAGARPPDANVPDAPGSGAAPGTGGAGGGGGDGGSGGATGAGGSIGTGGSTAAGGSGGAKGTGGSTGSGGSTSAGPGPCDIYGAANPPTPCVAAYSMIRALARTYTGPLYQVRKDSSSRNTGTGGTTADIRMLADGFADSAAQDAFCSDTTCTVSKLYDQSGKGNDLLVAKKGCATGTASEDDYESSATKRALTVGGHRVYALYMNAHEGYRNNQTTGMPTGTAAQGIYEVADGTHSGTGCCWDFGNASTDNCFGPSALNALFFGTDVWASGQGSGPWFLGHSENGLWPDDSGLWACGDGCSDNVPSMNVEFAFGVLKTQETNGALRVANAQSGGLVTAYDGQVPVRWSMQGGIVLGIGEDNSNSSYGTFYEGAITAGRPANATDEAVLKNVQAAGYGK